jgi:hypothetical protein
MLAGGVFMTDKQLKICAAVVRKHRLGDILDETGCGNYLVLQDAMPVGALRFNDDACNDDTLVTLADFSQEEYDKHIRDGSRYKLSLFFSSAALIISVIALLFSASSLFGWPFTPA